MLQQVTMPSGVKNILHATFTFNRTGNIGSYQGGDANLEEINKEAKSNISNIGVPDNEQWTRCFRNLEKMNEVHDFSFIKHVLTCQFVK